jgi:hypothetical protein
VLVSSVAPHRNTLVELTVTTANPRRRPNRKHLSRDAAEFLTGDVAGEMEVRGKRTSIAKFQGVPIPVTSMSGHVEAMCCYAGQSAGDVRAVQPAADIVAELVAGAAPTG